ncbi:hypothetical protein GLYMA_14G139850v4 [Glycine max]|nr:hypothetical protein GLYMA_14G139850v4 [Glycine max]KAH1094427.1 hypothetical protein GYH30_039923 [Glycine max]
MGTKFQLKVKNLDIEKWEQQLKEGKTYIAQNFEVESNKEDYKTTKHGYKLVFVKGTMLKEQDLLDIPHYVYDFTKFESIINKNVVADVLIEVIGEFVDLVQCSLETRPKKLVFTMRDEGEMVM